MKRKKTKSKPVSSMNEYYSDDGDLADIQIADAMIDPKKDRKEERR